ncbi:MAG: hypothetical protein M1299_12680 [Firmicutes bacterium]|nr:hypothetical protein [Bacillota bacterium]MCL5040647.1 hypothetical protein [Bacillota bacterium]
MVDLMFRAALPGAALLLLAITEVPPRNTKLALASTASENFSGGEKFRIARNAKLALAGTARAAALSPALRNEN